MKRLFGYLLLAAVGLAVISFFAAPAVAFMGIRSAAQAHDIAGLQKLVDFDAVRIALRPQLTQRMQAQTPPPSILRDPLEALKRQLEMPVVQRGPRGPVPDDYLRPEAIDALMRGEGRAAKEAKASLRPDKQSAPLARPVFWSLNRARLAVPSREGGRTVFTMSAVAPMSGSWSTSACRPAPRPHPPPKAHQKSPPRMRRAFLFGLEPILRSWP
ncbi:DUF2939 domain-containing protein [Brevundimonas sp.]|uniref:DUF2939 domain-containing protein n=1 Tax=Brevundimonas sp. TaxID=1871086 RepID=UPI00289F2F63|nr:DUF2939 domain-containing protein [Brevundimonas sp.]